MKEKGWRFGAQLFFFFFFSGSFSGVHKVQEQRQTSRDQARRRVGSMKKRALESFSKFFEVFFLSFFEVFFSFFFSSSS